MNVRCVVAEDESLLREALLVQLTAAWPELDIVAACEDGGAALEAIALHRPEIAFLDIRMPGLSGLEVAAAALEASPMTQLVFVTAYDQHALEAFERGAVDYLLKPVIPERLAATLRRLRSRLSATTAAGQVSLSETQLALAELLRRMAAQAPAPMAAATVSGAEPLRWITASAGSETRLIMLDDVAYFQSDTKYTVVMTADGEALLRTPLRELLAVLDTTLFKQIHRSTIVNLRAVAAVVRDEAGRGQLRLKNRPETLPVSLTFMPLFRNM
jgi:DNA-binding LytR/AlgR family response regulator